MEQAEASADEESDDEAEDAERPIISDAESNPEKAGKTNFLPQCMFFSINKWIASKVLSRSNNITG